MTDHKKFDSIEVQQQLKIKLEELFKRENLEKDVYFIARMNQKMEIPLQIVYQQKEIYKICPNGRYVLQALKTCDNIIVDQEQLIIIPKILPKKVRIYIRILDLKIVTIENFLKQLNEKSNIKVIFEQVISPTSAFLTVESESNATELYEWIVANKVNNEPFEVQIREESLYKVFKSNVKEDLQKYYEKLSDDKKSQEMYDNLSFFSNQQNFPVANKSKVGDNVFANPFNYFFFQHNIQEHNLQPSIRKSNGENAAQDKNQQQQQQQQQAYNPLAAFMMFQQQQMFGNLPNQHPNSRRNNNHFQQNGKPKTAKTGNRSKSRGQVENNNGNKNNSLNRSKSRKRQEGGKFSEKKGKNPNNQRNRSGEKISNKTNTKKGANVKTTKKSKPQKPIVDNEENFPSLLPNNNSASEPETTETEQSRATRKSSHDKKQNSVTINEQANRTVSESKERTRQVSESREKQIARKQPKDNKVVEETVYYKKGKEVKTRYNKEALVAIFKQIQDKITPPASILESSKDEFIPVININAAREIEITKPTEVELLPLSNPGTPYQGASTSIPYRKSSISRSNIKRKESEKIMEVDETKAQ